MPEASHTATVLLSSLVANMMSEGSRHIAANSTGTRKVVIRKLFFFTRLRYSRLMIIPIILEFIYAPSPSVTSLMKMSFILGISSL